MSRPPGFLAPRAGAKTTFEPLLMSSTNAAPIPAQRFNALTDPSTLRDGFKPTGIRYALAARITGPVILGLSAGRARRIRSPPPDRRSRT